MMDFSIQLQAWYSSYGRSLPWRHTKDPYSIWVSEIILQQTQVKQGLDYYNRFINSFPNIEALAVAEQDEVLKLWQGLGYYSRARNLHAAAQSIFFKQKNVFPKNYKDILLLKGIGPYTAAAIASFAFNLPYAVLDGNVYRVLSRLFTIEIPIDSTAGKKHFQELANQLLDKRNPALHNQAIMDFGAICCTPTSPKCTECPFQTTCKAYLTNTVIDFPKKGKRTKQRHRYFTFFFFDIHHSTYINKRGNNDIWTGLYEFPLIETNQKTSLKEVKKIFLTQNLPYTNITIKKATTYKHVLSHQIIHATFFKVSTNEHKLTHWQQKPLQRIPISELQNYPFPQLIIKFLNDNNFISSK
ncbi:A/G-specific adenine glycosylase [Marinilabiliaceae bacterium JC017]|nr:A/G-specific adenine glycosylase [Marinilabiliaceae bacterium JC017]